MPVSTACPCAPALAASRKPPLNTGSNREAASEPTSGTRLSTTMIATRIRAITSHTPQARVNSCQAQPYHR